MAKRTILATKLQEEDSLVDVRVVNEISMSFFRQRTGTFEIPGHGSSYKEKAAVGVRGIRLQKKMNWKRYIF